KGRNMDYASLEENRLWELYRRTADIHIRDELVLRYCPLVKYVAGKVSVTLPSMVEYRDLVGYGNFGLLDAIEKFDPKKHVKFKTYAVTRIRGAIYDHLRELDWVPRSVRRKTKQIERAIAKLESHLGRPATDEEIAAEMGIERKELMKIMAKVASSSILSLQEIWPMGAESEGGTIGDTLESLHSVNPDVTLEREEIRRVIVEAIQELPDKEKKVLVLYYYENLTLREIGRILEVTESRVSQLHTKAILRLRAKLSNRRKGIL
ncbi:MAG: RNA polymerase sigma factor WhiG, partial [Spirochaetia bacterium]|nr:RNA polymerase sigma factor WhiG [Spirochaetia bacterium]